MSGLLVYCFGPTMNNEHIKGILKKNGIDSSLPVVSFSSGQINTVYRIGDAHVLKIEKDLDVVAHQPELMQLAAKAGAKVPEVLDSGKTDAGDYLLMRLLPGRTVAGDWFSFNKKQQESLIEQMTEQLKILHSISFSSYAIPRPQQFHSWKQALHTFTDFGGIAEDGLDSLTRRNFECVRDFYFKHESVLDVAEPPVLVHNDVHFENVLHVNGTLTGLVDFDFARQAPKDYELWHILDFFQSPKYYVSQALETAWEKFVLTDELHWLCKYYPAFFTGPDIVIRQKLYLTENIVSTLRDGAVGKFNEKVEAYFKGDWLERVLGH